MGIIEFMKGYFFLSMIGVVCIALPLSCKQIFCNDPSCKPPTVNPEYLEQARARGIDTGDWYNPGEVRPDRMHINEQGVLERVRAQEQSEQE